MGLMYKGRLLVLLLFIRFCFWSSDSICLTSNFLTLVRIKSSEVFENVSSLKSHGGVKSRLGKRVTPLNIQE